MYGHKPGGMAYFRDACRSKRRPERLRDNQYSRRGSTDLSVPVLLGSGFAADVAVAVDVDDDDGGDKDDNAATDATRRIVLLGRRLIRSRV